MLIYNIPLYKHLAQSIAKLICLACMFLYGMPISNAQVSNKKEGWIDLRQWDYENNKSVALDGQWLFYWKTTKKELNDSLVAQKAKYFYVPERWDNYKINDQYLPRFGFATYQLSVILPKGLRNKPLALKLGEVSSAYNFYLGDSLIHRIGYFDTLKKLYKPLIKPSIIEFIPTTDTLFFTVEIANFNDRFGGLTNPTYLGIEQAIRTQTELKNFVSIALVGSFVFMALYHFSLYYFRRKKVNLATLHFAIFCILISIRTLVTEEYLIVDIFPNISFEIILKLSYLTFTLAVLFFSAFLKSLYPEDYSKKIFDLILIVIVPYSFFILISRAEYYNQFLVAFQLFAVFSIFYALLFSVLISIRKKLGAVILIAGEFVLFTATVNDILLVNKIINSITIAPFGLFAFFFSQTLLLSSRFSKAFGQVEELSEKLLDLNQNLENTVKERTQQLEQANEELQASYEDSRATLKIVNQQKVELEEKDKNITDSLTYAQRIQNSLLPDLEKISHHFQDLFILYLPREIVSGDFYFSKEIENRQILAVVDCTGHGVPGALMSMIGHQLLEQIISRFSNIHANEILLELHFGIQEVLKQQENQSNDGMDISLVILDKAQKIMEFAGAKNPLIYIQQSQLYLLKGDSMPVGGNQYKQNTSYKLHTVDIAFPTTIYLFSDGYQDQFGGEKKKKFLTTRFRQLLFEIHHKPMAAQKEILYRTIKEWISKGKENQIDDILVLGAKVAL